MAENRNKENVLTIILFILLLVAVGVICYLLGSNNTTENNQNNENNMTEEKENNEDSENFITPVSYTPKCVEENQTNLKADIDEIKYNNVTDYIKTQQNVKIKLSYCVGDEIEQIDYVLSEIEKNSALNEIGNHYIENAGLGGGACVPITEISYTRNNNSYFIKYWGHVMSSNDGNIYKIVDKISTLPQQSQESCHYFVQSLGSTINNITKYER